jgi:hypothetical protein
LQLEGQNPDNHAKMAMKERSFTVKPRSIRRSVVLVAAIAAVLLAISVTVFAVGSYLGAFDIVPWNYMTKNSV